MPVSAGTSEDRWENGIPGCEAGHETGHLKLGLPLRNSRLTLDYKMGRHRRVKLVW